MKSLQNMALLVFLLRPRVGAVSTPAHQLSTTNPLNPALQSRVKSAKWNSRWCSVKILCSF